jgi:hypothetical protein
MSGIGVGRLRVALVPAVVLGTILAPAPGLAQSDLVPARPTPQGGNAAAILLYAAPASATWGPSATGPPTHAFGKPAQVLMRTVDGYMVRQEMPLEDAMRHAAYVSQQIGQAIAVTIPDPAGGPARIEYVGRSSGDLGR